MNPSTPQPHFDPPIYDFALADVIYAKEQVLEAINAPSHADVIIELYAIARTLDAAIQRMTNNT